MKKTTTHYDNLQVSHHASASVIRAAYKALSQKWHPDLNPDRLETAYRNFNLIKHAYDVLSNPESRLKHDLWIKNTHTLKTKQIQIKEPRKIFNYASNENKKSRLNMIA